MASSLRGSIPGPSCSALLILLFLYFKYVRKDPAADKDSLFANIRIMIETHAEMTSYLTLLLATLGIMVGLFTVTGFINRMGGILLHIGEWHIIALILMAWVFGWLVGAGLPPTATYIVLAVIIVDPMRKIGIDPWIAHFFCFLLAVWGELSPPTSLAAAVSARIAEASFMRTMLEALKLCAPITFMTFAIFTRSNLVVNPGWMQIADMLLVAIACCGITCAIFGRFVRNRGSDLMWRAALALASFVVMFHPDGTVSLAMAAIVLPATVYGVKRHQIGRPAEERAAVADNRRAFVTLRQSLLQAFPVLLHRIGEVIENILGGDPVLALVRRGQVPGEPMDEDPFAHRFLQGQPEAGHGSDGSGQDIPRSRRRHPRIAAQVDEDPPLRGPDQGTGALQDNKCMQIRGCLLKDLNPLPFDLGNRLPCDARHLPRMGGQDRRRTAVPDDLRFAGQGGDPVTVDQKRLFDPGGQFPDEPLRFVREGETGADDHHIHLSGQRQEGFFILQREASLRGFRLGDEDDLAPPRREEGGHRPGGGETGIPPARLQKRHGGKVRGAEIARGAGDEQDVPHRSLVGRPLARWKRNEAVDLDLDRLIVIKGRREGDMADMESSAEAAAGIEHVPDLGKAEGDGVVRPDRRPHHFPRFAVDAGGDVQAEDRLAADVDQFDHVLGKCR